MLSPREKTWRRHGIGSSEAGVLAGHGLFRNVTPMTIWEDKIYGSVDDQTGAMMLGHLFEKPIAQWYLGEAGGGRLHKATGRVHRNRKWQRSTPDYYLVPSAGPRVPIRIVECKYVGPGMEHHWDPSDENGVPELYRDQVTWQMDTTGIGEAHIAAIFATWRTGYIWRFEREQKREEALRDVAEKFWVEHVIAQEPPPLDWTDASRRHLERQFGLEQQTTMAPPSAEAENWARIYDDARTREKAAKEEKDVAKNRLCELIGEHQGIEGPWGRATWKLGKGRLNAHTMLAEALAELPSEKSESLREKHRGKPQRNFRLAMVT